MSHAGAGEGAVSRVGAAAFVIGRSSCLNPRHLPVCVPDDGAVTLSIGRCSSSQRLFNGAATSGAFCYLITRSQAVFVGPDTNS